jgi:hypothetical protein
MRIVEVTLESISPYSQSRKHDTPKLEKEAADAYELRTWREKCTVDETGQICIPAMAFKQALDRVAAVLGEQVPGRGKATFTKHFKAGCICESDVPLGIRKNEVQSVTISANADGVRGSGKRVNRTFPVIPRWSGTARFVILDDTITQQVFERHLTQAGLFVGIGRFRPENGGLNGRFRPAGNKAFNWIEG